MPSRPLNFALATLLDQKTAALGEYRLKSTGKWATGLEKIAAGVRTRSYNDSVQFFRPDGVAYWFDGKLAASHTITTGKTNVVFGMMQVIEPDLVTAPEIAYIPATDEEWPKGSKITVPGDDPAKFAPMLKADNILDVRIWTNWQATYGNWKQWRAAGFKTIVTASFKENSASINDSIPPAQFAAQLDAIVGRLDGVDIWQGWNEPQYKPQYCPGDVEQSVAGYKRVKDLYFAPLAKRLGRDRVCGPSILPHHEGEKHLKMLVDAGFYDLALTRYADFHLYFYADASRQQIVDTVGRCKALLPAGIEIISSEFGKNVTDSNKDYARQQNVYAAYATLGISPMAHFMGGTMMRFQHTKGIYSRDGKRINDDVRGCLVKAGAKMQAAQSTGPIS